jgi:integrase
MSVRKRKWTTRAGEVKEAWIVDYVANGSRHIETFERKKDAEAREAEVTVNVDKGIHTAPSKSITIAQAADDWLRYVEAEGRERATIRRYRELVAHVVRRLGNEKLGKLTSPRVNAFRDDLLKTMSRPTARKVLITLKAILKEARRRGNVAQNVASDVAITSHGRIKPKLEVGRDIPTRDEIRRIVDAAKPGKARTILLTAALTGMRASELRGLR